ncbi:fructose-1-phosphate/6-phosphogluconate phosphatase, partial [Erwinia amylovora]|nr:fructose-1-phosphate/6-phosphogluconate phosphatase [Erwinia amylovora]
FEEKFIVGLSGSPGWRIAQAILILYLRDLDHHQMDADNSRLVNTLLFDTVQPMPVIDVVKSLKCRRAMAVGTGSVKAFAVGMLDL